MKKKLGTEKCLIRIFLIGVIIMGICILGTRAFAPTINVNDEKSFLLEGITSLQIDMTKEQIRIIEAQANEIKLHYYGTSKQDLKLSTKTNNGTIIIGSTRTTNLMQENLYVDIYLPEGYNAQLIINTTSGDVISEKCHAATITINSTSGKIALNDCAGNLNLKATSGDISAIYKTFGKQDINITATSGNIQLQLPGTAEFSLAAKTSAGKLHSDFYVTEDRNKMTGNIGNENNKVILQTSTGGINLLKK